MLPQGSTEGSSHMSWPGGGQGAGYPVLKGPSVSLEVSSGTVKSNAIPFENESCHLPHLPARCRLEYNQGIETGTEDSGRRAMNVPNGERFVSSQSQHSLAVRS